MQPGAPASQVLSPALSILLIRYCRARRDAVARSIRVLLREHRPAARGLTEEQTLGDQTSYTYQLAALADTLQTGAEFLIDVDDSVANAELIDEVYRRAGLAPRG